MVLSCSTRPSFPKNCEGFAHGDKHGKPHTGKYWRAFLDIVFPRGDVSHGTFLFSHVPFLQAMGSIDLRGRPRRRIRAPSPRPHP